MRSRALVGMRPEVSRTIALLSQVLKDGGRVPLRVQAATLGLPVSTAYRLVAQLHRAGLVSRTAEGVFTVGFELHRLASVLEHSELLADISRPHVRRLARRLKLTAHLGILQDDMVTYVAKEHGGGPAIFTRSGTQLEAYCSAIGKMLLAELPDAEIESYLRGGPFTALTSQTIIEPHALWQALLQIRSEGYAVDDEEVLENLRCVAVPLRDRGGSAIGAISVARRINAGRAAGDAKILAALRDCAAGISVALQSN